MSAPSGDRDVVSALEADLVALAAADADLERDAEVAERTRIERSRITLADRLRAAPGYLHVRTQGGAEAHGPVLEVGDGFVVVGHLTPGRSTSTEEHLVMLAAVTTVAGLAGALPPREGALPGRSVAAVLRAWCRDRSDVLVTLVDGDVLRGRASAAYADHLELAGVHGPVDVALASLAAAVRHA
jgi:hypothetical protein